MPGLKRKWGVRWGGRVTSQARGKSRKGDYWAENVKVRETDKRGKERKKQVFLKGRLSWSLGPERPSVSVVSSQHTWLHISRAVLPCIPPPLLQSAKIFPYLNHPESCGLVFPQIPRALTLSWSNHCNEFLLTSLVTKLKAIYFRNLHSLLSLRINGDPSTYLRVSKAW